MRVASGPSREVRQERDVVGNGKVAAAVIGRAIENQQGYLAEQTCAPAHRGKPGSMLYSRSA